MAKNGVWSVYNLKGKRTEYLGKKKKLVNEEHEKNREKIMKLSRNMKFFLFYRRGKILKFFNLSRSPDFCIIFQTLPHSSKSDNPTKSYGVFRLSTHTPNAHHAQSEKKISPATILQRPFLFRKGISSLTPKTTFSHKFSAPHAKFSKPDAKFH